MKKIILAAALLFTTTNSYANSPGIIQTRAINIPTVEKGVVVMVPVQEEILKRLSLRGEVTIVSEYEPANAALSFSIVKKAIALPPISTSHFEDTLPGQEFTLTVNLYSQGKIVKSIEWKKAPTWCVMTGDQLQQPKPEMINLINELADGLNKLGCKL